jgi:NADH dehydrogenase
MDEVVDIDVEGRIVITASGAEIAYDYLILSTGSVYSYFGHEDWPRLAPGLKTIEDATEIRRNLLLAFERAEVERDPAAQARFLTFVLVGGGPTGVEMAGAVAELAKATLARDFHNIDPRAARIVLVEAGPRLLNGFPQHLADYALDALTDMGVEVRLDTPIEHIDDEGVVARGERINASAVVWCAGVQATPVGDWLGIEKQPGGRIRVGPDLSVPGHPEIFVIGDAAAASDAEGRTLPGLAAVATQQGDYVGRLLARRAVGKADPGPFVYRNWGTMATIGRSSAVADFGRFTMRGYVAWLLWGLVHIYLLIGFRNRLAVFINWMWSWITYGRGARLITGPVTFRARTPGQTLDRHKPPARGLPLNNSTGDHSGTED